MCRLDANTLLERGRKFEECSSIVEKVEEMTADERLKSRDRNRNEGTVSEDETRTKKVVVVVVVVFEE